MLCYTLTFSLQDNQKHLFVIKGKIWKCVTLCVACILTLNNCHQYPGLSANAPLKRPSVLRWNCKIYEERSSRELGANFLHWWRASWKDDTSERGRDDNNVWWMNVPNIGSHLSMICLLSQSRLCTHVRQWCVSVGK